MASPAKKSKTRGGKGSVALLKENIQLGCVSLESPQKEPILREVLKIGIKSRSQVLHVRHAKIRQRKGPSQGVTQK